MKSEPTNVASCKPCTPESDEHKEHPFNLTLTAAELWGKEAMLKVSHAARQDVEIRYATTRTAFAVKSGLIPPDTKLTHGDYIASLIEGIPVIWKVNRKNGSTMAAHFPVSLSLPGCSESGLQAKLYRAVFLGPINIFRAFGPNGELAQEAPEMATTALDASQPSQSAGTTLNPVVAVLESCNFVAVWKATQKSQEKEAAV
ncbi:MAG: hypothetical protein HZA90_14870 [Verrucomicrobia bacterium]|nr:hypothetical protein [Verrucomicrobiota bacterium]